MTTSSNPKHATSVVLPLEETVQPTDVGGVIDAIHAAGGKKRAIYPLGGRTSLDFGLTPTRPGIGLDVTALDRVVDYTPRDMTIVVEAGVTVAALAQTLAAENQWLPIDVPRVTDATLGGAVATNWNGSRRYGHGTWRDYLIGITAVDGRGTPFRAGGRVVKNVAGYDFCKLLTGSLGALGVITQLVFKVKPRPAAECLLVVPCESLPHAEQAFDAIGRQAATPCIVELLVGSIWKATDDLPESPGHAWIVVGVEGTHAEVNWMVDDLANGLRSVGLANPRRLDEGQSNTLRHAMTEFSDRGPVSDAAESPLTIKATVPPSATVEMVRMLLAHDPQCAIQCHAGSGIVLARFAEFSAGDLTGQLIGKLRPAAIQRGGSLIVVSSTIEGLTPPIVWGGRTAAHSMIDKVKHAFDPHEILNPGRMI